MFIEAQNCIHVFPAFYDLFCFICSSEIFPIIWVPNCSWSGLSVCADKAFLEKKKRFVIMMMMLYADFKKTWPFMLIEILSDFPTSKLWKNLSFKSFSNFSFVVDEVLADELQQESLWNRSACTPRAWMKQLGPGTTKLLLHRPRCGKYFLKTVVSIRNEDAILGWGSERLRGLFHPLLTVFWPNVFFYIVDRAAWQ